jgi:hypothetical protein
VNRLGELGVLTRIELSNKQEILTLSSIAESATPNSSGNPDGSMPAVRVQLNLKAFPFLLKARPCQDLPVQQPNRRSSFG